MQLLNWISNNPWITIILAIIIFEGIAYIIKVIKGTDCNCDSIENDEED